MEEIVQQFLEKIERHRKKDENRVTVPLYLVIDTYEKLVMLNHKSISYLVYTNDQQIEEFRDVVYNWNNEPLNGLDAYHNFPTDVENGLSVICTCINEVFEKYGINWYVVHLTIKSRTAVLEQDEEYSYSYEEEEYEEEEYEEDGGSEEDDSEEDDSGEEEDRKI